MTAGGDESQDGHPSKGARKRKKGKVTNGCLDDGPERQPRAARGGVAAGLDADLNHADGGGDDADEADAEDSANTDFLHDGNLQVPYQAERQQHDCVGGGRLVDIRLGWEGVGDILMISESTSTA